MPSLFDPDELPDSSGVANFMQAGSYLFDTTTGELFSPGGTSLDANTNVISQGGGPDAMIIVFARLQIGPMSSLQITGDRPAIIATHGSAVIEGSLDLTSRRAGFRGAGSQSCGANGDGAIAQIVQMTGSGGGGGGAGLATGGGDGGSNSSGEIVGGAGGSSSTVPVLMRAGCRGADGIDLAGNTLAQGGLGGGAVQVSSCTNIMVSGVVEAGGAGGAAGIGEIVESSGGGGGGSGGVVWLEAQGTLAIDGGTVVANGGGGGSGSNVCETGNDGEDAGLTQVSALGGVVASTACGDGGSGGNGGARAATAGNGGAGDTAQSGGGGGGATGFILLRAPEVNTPGAVISPQPSFL
jgi:hypothetical protein